MRIKSISSPPLSPPLSSYNDDLGRSRLRGGKEEKRQNIKMELNSSSKTRTLLYNSTWILITLSTLWSTSLGMGTEGGGGGGSSSSVGGSRNLSLRSVIEDEGHKCFVCLPPDKSSRDAQDIVSLFGGIGSSSIPDCVSINQSNRKSFEFQCPPNYKGCQTRSHGSNVSRSCSILKLNDCKTANSVELCYCTGSLCNDQKLGLGGEEQGRVGRIAGGGGVVGVVPLVVGTTSTATATGGSLETDSEEKEKARLVEEKEEAESRKFWEKGETDDEDLLEMQDASGDGPFPSIPGVFDQYTTTKRPTLVPNKRGESSRSNTTPSPTSGASDLLLAPVPTIRSILLLSSALFFINFLLVNRT